MRELHWHPIADEWQYVVEGEVSVTLFGSHGRYRIERLQIAANPKDVLATISVSLRRCLENSRIATYSSPARMRPDCRGPRSGHQDVD